MPMLSRVAESIFWIARYVERAENTSRLLGARGDLQRDVGGAEPHLLRAAAARNDQLPPARRAERLLPRGAHLLADLPGHRRGDPAARRGLALLPGRHVPGARLDDGPH